MRLEWKGEREGEGDQEQRWQRNGEAVTELEGEREGEGGERKHEGERDDYWKQWRSEREGDRDGGREGQLEGEFEFEFEFELEGEGEGEGERGRGRESLRERERERERERGVFLLSIQNELSSLFSFPLTFLHLSLYKFIFNHPLVSRQQMQGNQWVQEPHDKNLSSIPFGCLQNSIALHGIKVRTYLEVFILNYFLCRYTSIFIYFLKNKFFVTMCWEPSVAQVFVSLYLNIFVCKYVWASYSNTVIMVCTSICHCDYLYLSLFCVFYFWISDCDQSAIPAFLHIPLMK